ncbi:MAG: hypothetical protein ACI4ED_09110 [Suilimivivens sp.]
MLLNGVTLGMGFPPLFVIDKIILSEKKGVNKTSLLCRNKFLLTVGGKSVIFKGKAFWTQKTGDFPENEEERL